MLLSKYYVVNGILLQDQFKAHSSVCLTNPTTKMSGTYVCKVATFETEEYQERSILVYGE